MVDKIYKIAITGKANTGKNTVSKLIAKHLSVQVGGAWNIQNIAFADPIKEMVRQMFPKLPKKSLYGPSSFRASPIPGAFKNGVPLTIRQLLIDLGTGVGREYKENLWLDVFDDTFEKAVNKGKAAVIVTDCRFRNEFDHLKTLGFYHIRLLRDSYTKINHSSETNQDSIIDAEFDAIIDNNGTLKDLKKRISEIMIHLEISA